MRLISNFSVEYRNLKLDSKKSEKEEKSNVTTVSKFDLLKLVAL